jgi:predicted nucleotide-binding protein
MVARVEPLTAVFNSGVPKLERQVELTREVNFAAFVFTHDDWTTIGTQWAESGQASPRDNVVF